MEYNFKLFYSEEIAFCDLALWSKLNKTPEADAPVRQQIIPKSEDRKVKKLSFELITKDKTFKKIYAEDDVQRAEETKEASQNYDVIVNAKAIYENLIARAHMMVANSNGTYTLVETKLATNGKKYHIDEMTFAYYIFSNAGYKISNIELLYINSSYYLDGEFDVNNFFRKENVMHKVLKNLDDLKTRLPIIVEKINSLTTIAPKPITGGHCMHCFNKDVCFKDLPAINIFNFFKMDVAKDIFLTTGNMDINESHLELLEDPLKKIELDCFLNKKTHVNKEELDNFLDKVSYPLYFLDYECVIPIVPIFQKSKAYQHIPFQFSLHIQKSPEAELEHYSFISVGRDIDPRLELAKSLVNKFQPLIETGLGSVIVYFKQYEMTRNNELAQLFPEFKDSIKIINEKVLDLYEVFKNRHLYSYKQENSASIKSVLPAFTDLSYDDMEIGNGLDAANSYLEYLQGDLEIENIYDSLEKYCCQDTFAMYKLLNILQNFSKK